MSEVSRRDMLKYAAGLGAATATMSPLRRPPQDGVAEAKTDPDFYQYLEDTYGEGQVPELDPERPTLIIDAYHIGQVDLEDESKAELEDLFAENGIDLFWLDHPEPHSIIGYETKYSYHVDDIIGEESFYTDETEQRMHEKALQVIFVPGDDGRIWCGEEVFAGYSAGDRCTVAFDTEESMQETTLHEIGHLTLDHEYEDEDNRGVMGQDEKLDFTEEEWQEIRDALDSVEPDDDLSIDC